jgi:hypothetical protein
VKNFFSSQDSFSTSLTGKEKQRGELNSQNVSKESLAKREELQKFLEFSFQNQEAGGGFLKDSLKKNLLDTCEKIFTALREDLNQRNHKLSFQKIILNPRDQEIENLSFLNHLKACFPLDKMGIYNIEIEAFLSSQNDHLLNHKLHLQVSVYDFVTENKLSEQGFSFPLDEF